MLCSLFFGQVFVVFVMNLEFVGVRTESSLLKNLNIFGRLGGAQKFSAWKIYQRGGDGRVFCFGKMLEKFGKC